MSDIRRDAKLVLATIAATCMAFAVGLAWINFKPSLPSVLGVAPPKFASAKAETKECKTVQALTANVKKEVGLPAAVEKNEQASVLAIVAVPRSDNPLFATSVLYRDTGLGEIYFTPQPLPWLAFNRKGALGVAYGIKDDTNGFVTRIYGRLDLVQIKRLHAGLLGDVDNSGDWYGGAFIEGRW